MKKKILTYPNPKLNQVSKDVNIFDKSLHGTIDDMRDTITHNKGLGLAAIQIGIPLNILVINYKGLYFEAVNPKLTAYHGSQTTFEGCLSIPNVNEAVKRYLYIEVEYQDRSGDMNYMPANGQLAVIWQHEMEHLKGGLYIDNLSNSKKKKLLAMYKKAKRA